MIEEVLTNGCKIIEFKENTSFIALLIEETRKL
jgi:hypothetical protein